MLGYWDFFPSSDPSTWGRVPAVGYAEIVESRNADLPVGGRYHGWFPMAETVTFSATATRDGFRDDGDHRQAHASIYRSYSRTDLDPLDPRSIGDDAPDGEDRHALLRVLLLTGFLADEYFADSGGVTTEGAPPFFGAEQVIVLSASSKTAIGFSQRAAKRDGLAVVGLTSSNNADFVRSLGFYDSVVTYDEIDDPNTGIALVDSVVIDMAGNPNVLKAVHEHLGRADQALDDDRAEPSRRRADRRSRPAARSDTAVLLRPDRTRPPRRELGCRRVPAPHHRGDSRVHRRQPRLVVHRRAPRP